MNKFFISDTHFAHRRIVEFEPETRPFDTIDEHDEELIRRWNATVAPDDMVIHLGDVVFQPATKMHEILPRLNGHKHLVLGNHDVAPIHEYEKHFVRITGVYTNPKRGILFSHYPVHPCQLTHRYKFNVHGHTHSYDIEDRRYINISCDKTNLTPVHEDEIFKMIELRSR